MSAESPARASRMRLGRSMGVATIALVALLLAAIAGIGLLGGTLVAGMAIGIGAALAAGWVALRASSRAR
ncbi:MAG TPA: hypothetical protein VEM93_10905, partial [Actinomycetota bacterium]|nr:hypothetical protein [Actinomycetota bacterium]